MTSPYLSIFDKNNINNQHDNIIPEEDNAYKFPYVLDSFQQEGIYRIYKNENILITAHTGSGKTVLAIYAIAHCLKHNKKVIYTSPTKSLSNQKYAEFIEQFGSVGIMTGDIKMNPDAQCVIMTTEILRNILYRSELAKKNKEKINENSSSDNNNEMPSIPSEIAIDMNDVGAVILDEVHYINDPDRGKVWEEVIVLLPREITLVMLSATIDKPEIFASWIGNIKEKPISLIPTSHRVVPLKHYYWKSFTYIDPNDEKERLRWELIEILDDRGKFKNYDTIQNKYRVFDINKLMDGIIDFLVNENYTPALFFKFSRKKCETICKMVRRSLLDHNEIASVEKIFMHYMKDYKSTYEILEQYQDVYAQLKKGVVYHHSGLIPILKEIIEILYSKGLVKILFATETFAIGVNMPTKTVLFTELQKFDNKGQRLLRSDEYMQMSGRAGRRGLDKFGSVILLPCMDLLSENEMRSMLTGKSPSLQSKFQLTYQFVLKKMQNDDLMINNFISKTFIMNENDKKCEIYSADKCALENKISELNLNEEHVQKYEEYQKINRKLGDRFFVLNKKDRIKFENQKKSMEESGWFKEYREKLETYSEWKRDLDKLEEQIWLCNYLLQYNIQIMMDLLKEESYVIQRIPGGLVPEVESLDTAEPIGSALTGACERLHDKITIRGIVATGINECNELLFTEMIFNGWLEDLDFPEIIAVLSSFINEKDPNSRDKYISDLKVPRKVENVLHKLVAKSEYFMNLEDQHKININSDYSVYLDFIEPAYIWASGGTIQDIYKATSIYDGNFVKAIMRINNICDNLKTILILLEKYELLGKIENYHEVLIRDITSINSLYVAGNPGSPATPPIYKI
jgi:superfamily II RNA helicase